MASGKNWEEIIGEALRIELGPNVVLERKYPNSNVDFHTYVAVLDCTVEVNVDCSRISEKLDEMSPRDVATAIKDKMLRGVKELLEERAPVGER
jgi:hypothetical protein